MNATKLYEVIKFGVLAKKSDVLLNGKKVGTYTYGMKLDKFLKMLEGKAGEITLIEYRRQTDPEGFEEDPNYKPSYKKHKHECRYKLD